MSDPQNDAHAGPDFKVYLYVFAALCVCTAMSFVVNQVMGEILRSAAVIMAIAVLKATLVAGIFMHLKYDWGKLYGIILPVCVLTVMLVLILSIDQTFVWHAYPESSVPMILQK